MGSLGKRALKVKSGSPPVFQDCLCQGNFNVHSLSEEPFDQESSNFTVLEKIAAIVFGVTWAKIKATGAFMVNSIANSIRTLSPVFKLQSRIVDCPPVDSCYLWGPKGQGLNGQINVHS